MSRLYNNHVAIFISLSQWQRLFPGSYNQVIDNGSTTARHRVRSLKSVLSASNLFKRAPSCNINHDLTLFRHMANLGTRVYQSSRSHLTISIYFGNTTGNLYSAALCHNEPYHPVQPASRER